MLEHLVELNLHSEALHTRLLKIIPLITAPKMQRLGLRNCCDLQDPAVDADISQLMASSKYGICSLDVTKAWHAPNTSDDFQEDPLSPIPNFITTISPNLEDLEIGLASLGGGTQNCLSILERMATVDAAGATFSPRLKALRILDLDLDPVLLTQLSSIGKRMSTSRPGRSTLWGASRSKATLASTTKPQ